MAMRMSPMRAVSTMSTKSPMTIVSPVRAMRAVTAMPGMMRTGKRSHLSPVSTVRSRIRTRDRLVDRKHVRIHS